MQFSKGIGQKLSLAKFFLDFLKDHSSEIWIKQGPLVLCYWWMPLKIAEHALVNATRTNICLLVLSLRWQLWCQNPPWWKKEANSFRFHAVLALIKKKYTKVWRIKDLGPSKYLISMTLDIGILDFLYFMYKARCKWFGYL